MCVRVCLYMTKIVNNNNKIQFENFNGKSSHMKFQSAANENQRNKLRKNRLHSHRIIAFCSNWNRLYYLCIVRMFGKSNFANTQPHTSHLLFY